MKLIFSTFMLGSAAALAFLPSRTAAADVTTSVDFASSYIFHGNTYSTGPCLQSLVEISDEGFPLVLTGWGNLELDNNTRGVLAGAKARRFSEVDLFVTLPLPVDGLELDVTVGHYMYPGVGYESDSELQLGIGRELLTAEQGFPVHAFFRYNRLIGGPVEGLTYLEGGIDGGAPLSGKWSWNYKLKIAWLDLPDGGPSGWSDLLATAGLEYALSEKLALTGSVSYIGRLDDAIVVDELYLRETTIMVGVRYAF